MNNICLFRNPEFGNIRAVSINSEPWLVGKDVAEALGYKNSKDALSRHVDPEDKMSGDGVVIHDPMGREQHPTIINESGVYSLVLSSKLPGAKKFKRWVTSEVLPSIRKTGVYAAPTVDAAFMRRLADEMEKKEKMIASQQKALDEMKPKLQYLDTILESPGMIATTQIAADYGLSAHKLNCILHDEGIQYQVNGQWILYAKHMGQGLAKSRTFQFTHKDGTPDTKMTTMWTQKGRVVIHNILTDRGIVPEMDRE